MDELNQCRKDSSIIKEKHINLFVPFMVYGPGGYFRNFWVGVCHWDPGTLKLY